ncbi:MAG: hypothetical protein AAFX45_12900 [Pseudomonadota bacterium]
MAHISISTLTGRHEPKSVAKAMEPLWQAAGHHVDIGQNYAADADVAFMHHDVSVIDQSALPKAPADARVVNGRALDIRKRGYSQLKLSPHSDWDGPVLIKTDLNSFGGPERVARQSRVADIMEWPRDQLARWNWKLARRLVPPTYPLLDHVRDVPDWVWHRPDLLVERFMPERDGPHYCLRGWMFLGTRGYSWRLISHDPMVKTGTMVGHEFFDDIPPELERARAACNIDFGKIDYVVHDNLAIVLDINKTPFFHGDPNSPRLRDLAGGIEDFLK